MVAKRDLFNHLLLLDVASHPGLVDFDRRREFNAREFVEVNARHVNEEEEEYNNAAAVVIILILLRYLP